MHAGSFLLGFPLFACIIWFAVRFLCCILRGYVAAGDELVVELRKLLERNDQKLGTILEHTEGVSRAVINRSFSSRIVIPTEIPAALLEKESLNGSQVGRTDCDAETMFIQNQLLPVINTDWAPNVALPADMNPLIRLEGKRAAHHLRYLAAAVEVYSVLDVGNDNQFNFKVDIVDAKRAVLHLSCRVDFLIVPRGISKLLPILEILNYTIVFIEVESSNKGMENACLQLLTSLLALAHVTGKQQFYGIVISADFTQAQLIKFEHHGCYKDGIFHPSKLNEVVEMILQRRL